MILPTIAAVIADVLGLGPAHGIGPSTRLCEDLKPKPGYNPLGGKKISA